MMPGEKKASLLASFFDGTPLYVILAQLYLFVTVRQIRLAEDKTSLKKYKKYRDEIDLTCRQMEEIHSRSIAFCGEVAKSYVCYSDKHKAFDNVEMDEDYLDSNNVSAKIVLKRIKSDKYLSRSGYLLQKCSEVLFVISTFYSNITKRVKAASQNVGMAVAVYGAESLEVAFLSINLFHIEFYEYCITKGSSQKMPDEILHHWELVENILKSHRDEDIRQFIYKINSDILNATHKKPKINPALEYALAFTIKVMLAVESPMIRRNLNGENIETFRRYYRSFGVDYEEYFLAKNEILFLQNVIDLLVSEDYPGSLAKLQEEITTGCPDSLFRHL